LAYRLEEASDTYAQEVLSSILHPQDNVRKAWNLLLYGKIDAIHFKKTLPYTYQAIQDGSIKADDTFKTKIHVVISSSLRGRLPCPSLGSDLGCTLLELLAVQVAKKAIPEHWARNATQKEWIRQVHKEFAIELHERFLHASLKDGEKTLYLTNTSSDTNDTQHIVHMVFECIWETCQNWSSRVDQALFSHQTRSGTFLFLCPTSPSTLSDYSEKNRFWSGILYECLDDQSFEEAWQKIIRRKDIFRYTFSLVRDGGIDTINSCWECGGGSHDCLMVCSACKIALYCGKECQAKAWNGHKSCCTTLEAAGSNLIESINVLLQTCQTELTIEGIKPNWSYDLRMLDFSICKERLFDESQCEIIPNGPSLKYFYRNLSQVKRGEWWFYPEIRGLHEYEEEANTEFMRFADLFTTLCYDIDGAASEFVIHFLKSVEYFGPKMPAERFLEIYEGIAANEGESVEILKQLSNNVKMSVLNHLRKKHSKPSNSPT
jgi:hypothetical protein